MIAASIWKRETKRRGSKGAQTNSAGLFPQLRSVYNAAKSPSRAHFNIATSELSSIICQFLSFDENAQFAELGSH